MKGYWHKSEILSYLLKIDDSLTKAYRLKEAYRVFNLTASFNDCDERLDELISEFRNSKVKTIIKNSNGIRYFYRFKNKVLYSINKDVPITNK